MFGILSPEEIAKGKSVSKTKPLHNKYTKEELESAVEVFNEIMENNENDFEVEVAMFEEIEEELEYRLECRQGTEEEAEAAKHLEIFKDFSSDTAYLLSAEGNTMLVDILWEALEECTYDNGKPLISDEHNYFDHYTRDPYEVVNEASIAYAEVVDGRAINFISMYTIEDFKSIIMSTYDNAEWDHDHMNEGKKNKKNTNPLHNKYTNAELKHAAASINTIIASRKGEAGTKVAMRDEIERTLKNNIKKGKDPRAAKDLEIFENFAADINTVFDAQGRNTLADLVWKGLEKCSYADNTPIMPDDRGHFNEDRNDPYELVIEASIMKVEVSNGLLRFISMYTTADFISIVVATYDKIKCESKHQSASRIKSQYSNSHLKEGFTLLDAFAELDKINK